MVSDGGYQWQPKKPAFRPAAAGSQGTVPPPNFSKDKPSATREAFADALVAVGQANPLVVVLDGDVKNSTYTEKFQKKFPERFFEGFIAEQNAVGAATGLAACGKISFFATFAAFLTRAADFLRMSALGRANIKIVGTHAGVSIGEDGSSQMGLEDLSMMRALPESVVLYPSDGPSAWAAVRLATDHKGFCYIRTSRPATPVFYDNTEIFSIGRCKVARQSDKDKLTVVAAGVTFFEALKAADALAKEGISLRVIDLFSVKPIDAEALIRSGKATQNKILVVEDHFPEGGIGEAVASAVSGAGIRVESIAVREIPHSGKPQELLDKYGLSAAHIQAACKKLI
jgi:transketolase